MHLHTKCILGEEKCIVLAFLERVKTSEKRVNLGRK